MKKFIIDGRYADILLENEISIVEVLRKAKLPEDTFKHKNILLSEEEYFLFLETLGNMSNNNGLPIHLATMDKIESFSPPIFAAYCSKNGEVCIERLSRYKKLIGPMHMDIVKTLTETRVEFYSASGNNLPQFLVETEFAFLLSLLRKTTKENINPVEIGMRNPKTSKTFEDFFTIKAKASNINSISFRNVDLKLPFISYNEAMWGYFEPELARRLSELDVDDSISARVRAVLTELLASGYSSIEDVAQKLGLSKRTLQRKLSEEGTSFQKQLNGTRELLAINYIRNTEISTNDIAFLLGYQEINSFLRAFSIWTGMSISEYKQRLKRTK